MTTRERGTNRLTATFKELLGQGRKAFIPYITAGDPDLAATYQLVLALEQSGASIVELGVPFTDPVADGPVIQEASSRALAAGTTLRKVLKLVGDLRLHTRIPIVLLTYYNPLLKFGLQDFARQAATVGVDGVIVADLPVEEADQLREALDEMGLALIPLVAPTSPRERIQYIAEKARGFIYCVSLTGVTGTRDTLAPEADMVLNRVREATDLPLAMGFGISSPAQVAAVAQKADGVIVGSAIVKVIAQNLQDRGQLVPVVQRFAQELAQALSK